MTGELPVDASVDPPCGLGENEAPDPVRDCDDFS
jgi:hypothetical protein